MGGGLMAGLGSGLAGGDVSETRGWGADARGAIDRVVIDASDVARLPNIVLHASLCEFEAGENGGQNRLPLAILLWPIGQQIGKAAKRIGRF